MQIAATKERLLWMSFTVILLFISLSQFVRLRQETADAQRQAKTVAHRAQQLNGNIDALRSTIHDLKVSSSVDLERYRKSQGLLDESQIAYLKSHGLHDPIRDLTADLQKHPELIPHKGVLGGRMGFYDPGSIHILDTKWVLAGFDDGHIYGNALLEYQLSKGEITWRIIDSYIQQ